MAARRERPAGTATRRTRVAREATPIEVKLGRMGGVVSTYLLEEDSTVFDLLEKADIDFSKGDRVRVNSEPAEGDTILEDGDIVTLSSKVSGGF